MEVRPGYKLTEVGVIPEDWCIEYIGNITSCTAGGTPSTHIHSYWGGDHPWMSSGELHIKQIFDVAERITDEGLLNSSTKYIPKNSVLIGLAGQGKTRGTVAINRIRLCTNQSIAAIFPSINHVTEYLYYNLDSRYEELRKLSTGDGGRGGLNLKIIKNLCFPLPSIEEQTAIATALSDVDALLDALEKLIAKKRDIKQATMQQLLTGKTRLPEFSYRKNGTLKGIKQTDLGEIPDDWSVKNIGTFTNSTAGGTPNTRISSYWGGTHPWMSSGELHLKQVFDVAERITDEGLEKSSTKYIPKNSVLIGLAGQGKTRGTVAINRIRLCTNQSIAAIFPSKNHVTEYLYYNLESRYEELRSLSTGDGGRGGLNLKIINSLNVPMPLIEEQTAIAQILSDMDSEIEALEIRRTKTQAIKTAMMQELLTGKTRLI